MTREWRSGSLVAVVLLMTTGLAFGQASSTFNGRVLDQADAVLPGVTVTVTNQNTGVVRTTVTNEEGLYFLPGLEPGVYRIATELPGFQSSVRDDVNVTVNVTLTVDFKLSLAGVAEAVTVTGRGAADRGHAVEGRVDHRDDRAPEPAAVTRNVSGMLALLPGAVQIEPVHRSKTNVGSVSFGGSSGTNVIPSVDGADNRDNQFGGSLLAFSTEAIEQFQLATSQFNAADGRTGGAALTMVTKSGTNVLHGSGFAFGRSDKMTAKDYFTAEANREKTPSAASSSADRSAARSSATARSSSAPSSDLREDSELAVPDKPVQRETAARERPGRRLDPSGLRQSQQPDLGRAAVAGAADHRAR